MMMMMMMMMMMTAAVYVNGTCAEDRNIV